VSQLANRSLRRAFACLNEGEVSMARLEIEEGPVAGAWVITLRGDLDLATSDQLAERIAAAQRRPDATHVVVDLGALEFMDSTGLRVLLAASAASVGNGHPLRVRPGPRQVQRVFEATGTEGMLHFE
jgi:anti-sigma B factor antagonist